MTARTPDVLASALPAGITYDAAVNLRWDTTRIARFQAERLAEAGYVLVHPETLVRDEAVVERLAQAISPALFASNRPDQKVGPATLYERGIARSNVQSVLAALADTSAQARHTADHEAGGGAS